MSVSKQIKNTAGDLPQPLRLTSRRRPLLTIAIASGKGGVGKTLTTVNMALAARSMGREVLIFDGDLGLANVDIVLGLAARFNIHDVLNGHARLADIVVRSPLGLDVIPSGSGVARLTRLSHIERQQLLDQISDISDAYDLMLVDTGAGIADNVASFCAMADSTVVVTTPEPHAMTDAYALIKVLAEDHGVNCFNLLINQVRSREEGLKIAARIAEVALQYLRVKVVHLGTVPVDPQVSRSVMQRRAISVESTHTIAGQAWHDAARKLLGDTAIKPKHLDMQQFWQGMLVQEPTSRDLRRLGSRP